MRLILLIKTMKIRTSPNNNEIFVFITIFIINACFAGTIPATPENITVTFITPTTVRISWQTMIDLNAHPIEKYIVTYKPTDDRVVQDVAGNSEAVVLDRLSPSTQYSIAVTAIWLGKKYRSRQIIFRTLDSPKVSSQQDFPSGIGVFGRNIGGTMNSSAHSDDVTSTATNTLPNGAHRELPTIRGVEIGIVLIVLMVWAGAIALFFNRWGKIRMLLPYQPDYKHEQLKVPGTGVCSGGVCNGQHSHQFEGSDCGALSYQPLHHSSRHFHMLQEEHSTSLSERCTRNRINSAIFVSSEGKGFDSIEFLRRHGSQSVLCRKAKSAENITDNERKKSISNKQRWRTEESSEAINEQIDNETIETEFQQSCSSKPNDKRTLSVLNSYKELQASDVGYTAGRSATVTTSNVVIGSISIETPPAHLKFDVLSTEGSNDAQKQLNHSFGNELNNTISDTHDSTDTMEEIILLPTGSMSHALVHQCSSTSTNKSQSPTMSPHYSPKSLNMKGVKTKINTLPMVSVSGPSPPDDDRPPSGNL